MKKHSISGVTHIAIPTTVAKFGFTLSEVLITLGIIGVVAAMTIPILITNYQKKEIVTKLRRAISILNLSRRYEEGKGPVVIPDCSSTTTAYINTNCSKTGTGSCCAEKIRRAGWEIDSSYPW